MRQPSLPTIKLLFSRSAGLCNICGQSVLEKDVVIGDMAHVIAHSPDGPRGLRGQSGDNSYENLILLCLKDHRIVDRKKDLYPAEMLLEKKRCFEENIKKRIQFDFEYDQDLTSLNNLFIYIPIKKFYGMVSDLPFKISINFDAAGIFQDYFKDDPTFYPFRDSKLTNYWDNLLYDMHKIDELVKGYFSGDKFITLEERMKPKKAPDDMTVIHCTYINEGGFMYMNKSVFNRNQRDFLESEMTKLVNIFLENYHCFIKYIHEQYRTVKW
ncbi:MULTISPECIES: HNH endonuclease signature motif containing protein [unclassified Pseudoalteromonas]|uniref:HNH endonuclease n=1 Tax=unclassified Pseudoalteromonas TaxID=194690 RepID=UPI000C068C3C|nr:MULTISPECIES: HNH endonuclease signature motif containing protein [unclassified Pseudoalteromonas]MDP2633690.1 HNH endonuclease signature motif containing protein [Pseudoalteromonas sp. 1_MG-2023]PHN89672.1 hypothetical protein CSC79_11785 [Pseudoalteromonas sp. 3D05]